MKLSRSFVSMLIGFAMTILSWFGPSATQLWLGAPGIFVLKKFFGDSYDGFAYAGRAGVIVVLIVVNVGTWAVVAFVLLSLLRIFGKRGDSEPSP